MKSLSHEEERDIQFFLRGGDSAIRDLVVNLVDRIAMNERTEERHPDPVVKASAKAHIEAYRYAIFVAIRSAESRPAKARCNCDLVSETLQSLRAAKSGAV